MGQTKLTRRQWAGAVAAAQAAVAQTPPPRSDAPADLLAQAKQSVQRNREALSQFKLDRSVEPAARFEP
jgi:hypothetical protein